jgi:hypothetical protein
VRRGLGEGALPSPLGLSMSEILGWTPGITGAQRLTWSPKGA